MAFKREQKVFLFSLTNAFYNSTKYHILTDTKVDINLKDISSNNINTV